MKTIHGYDDTQKVLTREQWDSATTEQRTGFLAEGYLVVKAGFSKLAEEQIERMVEKMTDRIDARFMADDSMTQADYDAEMKDLKDWADTQYDRLSPFSR